MKEADDKGSDTTNRLGLRSLPRSKSKDWKDGKVLDQFVGMHNVIGGSLPRRNQNDVGR